MADEARHTSQHSSHWDSTGSLRSKPVSFVSAGSIEPLKELEEDLNQQEPENNTTELDQPQPSPSSQEEEQEAPLKTVDAEDENADADGTSVIGPEELEQAILRATDSDGEQGPGEAETHFFFDLTGNRHVESAPKAPVSIPIRSPEPEDSSSDEVILFKGRDATSLRRAPEPALSADSTTMTLTQMETEIRAVEEDLSILNTAPRGRSQSTKTKGNPKGKQARRRPKRQQIRESHEYDDDAAIVEDYLANMRENGEIPDILVSQGPDGRNTRDLGGSDNEIYKGEPETTTIRSKALEQQEDPQKGTYESESELDDATLAKLLAGHVPGAEGEMALEDFASTSSDSSESDDGPVFGQGIYQDVDIDDFDLMDWNRPSLRKKKGKAGRGQIAFDVSDDDLEQALQTAWKNDRHKKSERKKQREELRALGMLGKHAIRPEDLRTKYPTGMDIQQVGEEIKSFLRGSSET